VLGARRFEKLGMGLSPCRKVGRAAALHRAALRRRRGRRCAVVLVGKDHVRHRWHSIKPAAEMDEISSTMAARQRVGTLRAVAQLRRASI